MKTKLTLSLLICFCFAIAEGHPVPQNLGNGLNKILENALLQAGTIAVPAPPGNITPTLAYVNAYKPQF